MHSIDINPDSQRLFQAGAPMHNYTVCDLTRFDWLENFGYASCISAGFPCQPFSSIGKNRGLLDKRALVLPALYTYILLFHPKTVTLENVANFASGGEGLWRDSVLSFFRSHNYTCHDTIVNGQLLLPQKRKR